jgi:endonuclease/exonuclease/phosphatase family metal-dependent hydrolase
MIISRRTMIAAAAAMPLAACTTSATSPQRRPLRIVTFNIWHDMGNWPARRALLIEELRKADADVIALQEVLEDSAKSLPNQAETLAAALGGYSVHFTSTDAVGAPRRYGNAILSRLPVLDTAERKLEPLNDYRTALRARVRAGSQSIDVVNTHLAWQDDAGPVRARQIADLMAWLPRGGAPLIVLGDFNAPLSDSGLAALTSPRFASALPLNSAPTTLNPAKGHKPRVIDHIFFERAHFAAESAHVIGDRPVNGEYPSDHFGVVASLRIR